MEVRLLGPVELVSTNGERAALVGAKVRGVLAILALEAGRPVTPSRLLDAVWTESEPATANALQVAVAKLRRALGDVGERNRLTSSPAGYVLELEPEMVDALRFERLAQDPARVDEGLALWRGSPLADVPDTETTRALRVHLDQVRLAAEETRAASRLASEDPATVVPELTRLADAEPLRERRWALLMRAQYGAGQQAEALRTFARARQLLSEQIGVEPGAELRDLEAAVLHQDDLRVLGRTVPPALGTHFRRRGNLPHPIGSLIGRDDALARLQGALSAHRLVTLTGPGGVGKTRLALALGGAIEPDIADGVWFVDLVAARDAADVVLATHRALGLDDALADEHVEDAAAAVAALTASSAVVIFDNCEQVVDAVARFAARLLERSRDLQVVATSREPLGVPGELVVSVEPLSPDSAVALFAARTAGLGLTDLDPTVVTRICDRLDRLPLGIELAAGRARHLHLEDLLARLDAPLAVLAEGARTDAPQRRGLRGVAEWSYRLLDDAERTVFECLCVFADGATLPAAVAVATSLGIPPHDVERVLHRLVDKSLVYVDHDRGHTRYRMLQTLYDFSREQLTEHGAERRARLAQAEWVAALATTVRFGARTTGGTIAAVQEEDVAIRDALEWATVEDPGLAVAIAGMLAPYWFGSMRVSSGWDLLRSVLDDTPGAPSADRIVAAAWAALFATMTFDAVAAARFQAEVAAGEASLEDPVDRGVVALTRSLGAGYANDGAGHDWAARARLEFTAAGHEIGRGHVDFTEGALYVVEGAPDDAARCLASAIDAFRLHGDHLGLVLGLSRLGELAWRRGDLARFLETHQEMRDLGRASRTTGVVAGATARLAMGHLALGDIDTAERLAREALASSGGSFMAVVNGFAFRSAALVDLARGHIVEGRRGLLAAIDAFARGAGQVGAGYAALCRLDLARSLSESGDIDAARDEAAIAAAEAAEIGDRWVLAETAAVTAALSPAP